MNDPEINKRDFLKTMRNLGYPSNLIDKGAVLLKELCEILGNIDPSNTTENVIYEHCQNTVQKFNDSQLEFEAAGSEFDTMAREFIADEFFLITQAFGYNLDLEKMISNRHW